MKNFTTPSTSLSTNTMVSDEQVKASTPTTPTSTHTNTAPQTAKPTKSPTPPTTTVTTEKASSSDKIQSTFITSKPIVIGELKENVSNICFECYSKQWKEEACVEL